MQDALATAGDAVAVGLRALAAVAFTLVGMFVELNALVSILSGEFAFGLWALYMGAIALYAGLFVFGADVAARVTPRSA